MSKWHTFEKYFLWMHIPFLFSIPFYVNFYIVSEIWVIHTSSVHDSIESQNDCDVLFVTKYISRQSKQFVRRLQRLFQDKNCTLKTVFTTDRVKNYFSLKSKTPIGLRSSVIYKFSWSVDPSIPYVGRTYRNLVERVREHARVSVGQCNSAIEQHRLECTCNCKLDNFNILETCKDNFELSIFETLHIKRLNPVLNRSIANMGGTFFLKLFN